MDAVYLHLTQNQLVMKTGAPPAGLQVIIFQNAVFRVTTCLPHSCSLIKWTECAEEVGLQHCLHLVRLSVLLHTAGYVS